MITVTLNYGLTKTTTVQASSGATIRSLVTSTVRAILGLPENVAPVVDGDTLSSDEPLYQDTVITFEKQAAQKAL